MLFSTSVSAVLDKNTTTYDISSYHVKQIMSPSEHSSCVLEMFDLLLVVFHELEENWPWRMKKQM